MSTSTDIENINETKLWVRNYFLSIIMHLLIVVGFVYLYNLQVEKSKINSITFSLDTREYIREPPPIIKDMQRQSNSVDEEKNVEKNKVEEIQTVTYSDIKADTTNLDQIYTEPSLNVKISYPTGWTFIDQNKNSKLDGVTFWENSGSYNPPPYIHLEVVSKDMFIEKRYSFKIDFEKYKAFYNRPEEMQGFFTQIIYIRTDDEEDFQIKLMVKGKTEFESFYPKFWAILKTFDFRTSLF